MSPDDADLPLLLHALADGELDAAAALALEARIRREPALGEAFSGILAAKAAVGRLQRPPVTDDFAARIAALALPRAAPHRRWNADWRRSAAALVVTAALASAGTVMLVAPRTGDALDTAIVDSHRRSLLAASPIDVASSDRHTVRPWLDGKLGVAPPAPDLAARGFTLVGARVDVVDSRPCPSLVYRHKEHLITVLALPVAPGHDVPQRPTAEAAGGYNLVRWSQPGFRFWAVSDLDASELLAFADAMRRA